MPSFHSACLLGCMSDRAAVTHQRASLSRLCLTARPVQLSHVAVHVCHKRHPSRATSAQSARECTSLSSPAAALPYSQGLARRSRYDRKRLSVLSKAAVMGRKVEVSRAAVVHLGQRGGGYLHLFALCAPIPRSFVEVLVIC